VLSTYLDREEEVGAALKLRGDEGVIVAAMGTGGGERGEGPGAEE
jgi:hypothetical protein